MLSSSSSSIGKSSSTITLSFPANSDCTTSGLMSPLSFSGDRRPNDLSSTVYDDDDDLFSSRLASTSDVGATLPLNIVNPCYQSPLFSRQERQLKFDTFGDSPTTTTLNNVRRAASVQITRRFPLKETDSLVNCLQSSPSNSPDSSINNYDNTDTSLFSQQNSFPTFSVSIDSLSAPVMDYLDEKLIHQQISKLIKQPCCSSSSLSSSSSFICDEQSFPSYNNSRSGAPKRLILEYLSRFRKLHTTKGNEQQLNPNKITNNNKITEALFGGMPLNIIQSKTEDGSPLPRFVHDIMEYIEGYAHLTEWLFRKNGVKGRIEEIKDCCSQLSPNSPIPTHLLAESQIFDLCDALKLFFRSLPECLFTNKVSSLLQNWLRELPTTYSPKHFQIAQYSILILPAENREALLILLRFLCGIARHSNINKMNSLNLATCWMPSIFLFFNSQPLQQKQQRQNSTIPLLSLENGGNGIRRRLMRRKTIEISLVNAGGITNLTTTENTSPTLQNKNNNSCTTNNYESIKQLLSAMIDGWEKLILLPTCLIENNKYLNRLIETCRTFNNGAICLKIKKNGQFEFNDELHQKLRRMLHRLKEDYSNGWLTNNTNKCWKLQRVFSDGAHIYTRSINDMAPNLKSFLVQTSVPASPNLILSVLINGRTLWDPNVIGIKRVGPSGQNFDIVRFQYKPTLITLGKCSFLARRWTYNEIGNESPTCSLIECSVTSQEDDNNLDGGDFERVYVHESKFLIVPRCAGFSQIIYISRIDFKGRSSHWYEQVYAEMLVRQMQRLTQNLLQYKNRGITL
uniref:Rho-GAP domain-containing protein n=1 Tax=Meloidogyne enterolobii TaxID=390850 RepID=A0A6V7TSG7_MELEN|nr:unnamed protein product [Meloidogyne enterolobii]